MPPVPAGSSPAVICSTCPQLSSSSSGLTPVHCPMFMGSVVTAPAPQPPNSLAPCHWLLWPLGPSCLQLTQALCSSDGRSPCSHHLCSPHALSDSSRHSRSFPREQARAFDRQRLSDFSLHPEVNPAFRGGEGLAQVCTSHPGPSAFTCAVLKSRGAFSC